MPCSRWIFFCLSVFPREREAPQQGNQGREMHCNRDNKQKGKGSHTSNSVSPPSALAPSAALDLYRHETEGKKSIYHKRIEVGVCMARTGRAGAAEKGGSRRCIREHGT
jgi:hypothetical protein